jgi:hypothetical protein
MYIQTDIYIVLDNFTMEIQDLYFEEQNAKNHASISENYIYIHKVISD